MQFNIRSPVPTAMFAALALAVTAYFMAAPTDALTLAPNGTDQVITTAPMTHDPPTTELVTLAAPMLRIGLSAVDIVRTIATADADSVGAAIIVRQTTTKNALAASLDIRANTFVDNTLNQAEAAGDISLNRMETGRGDAPISGNVATIGDSLVSLALNSGLNNTATKQTAAINNISEHIMLAPAIASCDNYPNPFNAIETPDFNTAPATAMLGQNSPAPATAMLMLGQNTDDTLDNTTTAWRSGLGANELASLAPTGDSVDNYPNPFN